MLLISHPSLRDPNFLHSVIYLSTADAESGAFGVIINRPTGQKVGDILSSSDELEKVSHVPVFLGGPVATDQLIFVAFTWNPAAEQLECAHHLNPADLGDLLHDPLTELRAYIGYAGWGKGQLEREVAQGAWLLQTPLENTLAEGNSGTLWRDVVSSFGPKFQLMAEAPENPSLN